LDSYVT